MCVIRRNADQGEGAGVRLSPDRARDSPLWTLFLNEVSLSHTHTHTHTLSLSLSLSLSAFLSLSLAAGVRRREDGVRTMAVGEMECVQRWLE